MTITSLRAFLYNRGRILLTIAAVVGAVWGLLWLTKSGTVKCDLDKYAVEDRDALVPTSDPYGEVADKVVYLPQGWTPAQSMDFYTRTQGSRLLPYEWFLALEQSNSETLFRDNGHMQRLRYLTQKPNHCNPDGLPVGFVKDPKSRGDAGDWLGLTCAACHTTEVHYNKIAYRIDGGPTMGDIQTLLIELTQALHNTHDYRSKFDRFAARVLKNDNTGSSQDLLRKQLAAAIQVRDDYDALNKTAYPYGHARLDAFGRILNQVLVHDIAVSADSQKRSPDAPVSYPFLWDTPHHDRVQWNGMARNKLIDNPRLGALARNSGQVLGVFGQVHVSEPGKALLITGYSSSVQVPNLIEIEDLMKQLLSPEWSATGLPPIDPAKRDRGKGLFTEYCNRCHDHEIFKRADPNREIKAERTPIAELETDDRMAKNFADRKSMTGRLAGRRALFVVGSRFGSEAEADAIFLHVVGGTLIGAREELYGQDFSKLRAENVQSRTMKLMNDIGEKILSPEEKEVIRQERMASLMVYKARPLNGIWATAPFLHNGSVPNLYELLLPTEKRSKSFTVGRREFDPKHVGFKTDVPNAPRFQVLDNGKPIPGNSNAGHEYFKGPKQKVPFTDAECWDLVEYMKSL